METRYIEPGVATIRITDLTALQGVSKQLCYQSLRPIEKAGFIFRKNDPSDGREILVKLTPVATKMVEGAFTELNNISINFLNLIGVDNFTMLNSYIARITPSFLHGVKNSYHDLLQQNTIFAAPAGQISRHFETQLINLNSAKGHHGIRHSFSRVLAYVNLNGSQIKTIAKINDVSNQAIVRIATELEKLGYIERTSAEPTQPNKRIIFTQHGLQLIKDSVESVITLEAELEGILGKNPYNNFCIILKDLYDKIGIERQTAEDYVPKLITIGTATGKVKIPQNELNLPELLLFIASLCEDATTPENTANRLTKNLPRKTDHTLSSVTFVPGSNRILGNTTRCRFKENKKSPR